MISCPKLAVFIHKDEIVILIITILRVIIYDADRIAVVKLDEKIVAYSLIFGNRIRAQRNFYDTRRC